MPRCLIAPFCWLRRGNDGVCCDNSAKPNIIFVLVDDLRWDDLGLCRPSVFANAAHRSRRA